MRPSGRLGIDFGTSNTVAVITRPDGLTVPLLCGETPLLPSAVCLDSGEGSRGGEVSSDRLLVGRDALHAGRSRPELLEPNPKRRIDEGAVLLGDREIPVAHLIAAVLQRVAIEARRVGGDHPIAETVLTCPADWGSPRRQVPLDAARTAGLSGEWGTVRLLVEPVAAAA